jgi:O-acetyl-ADP-ribose deacetylase (regulator of RNase III)
MTAVLILNIVFAAAVVITIVGGLAWSIVSQNADSTRLARAARHPRTKRARARIGIAVENRA